MSGHNICFHREIRKIIFELSSLPPLIWSSVCGLYFQIAGLPSFVKVVEVGPRDGLQNEKVR